MSFTKIVGPGNSSTPGVPGYNAVTNTGGGGGGAFTTDAGASSYPGANGGNGGSGIVLIAYPS